MAEEQKEISEKEVRIRSITHLYYSNPIIQKALMDFAIDREVVPRYFEGFGKRPDILQYSSDILGAVKRGATSFHSSEEIWRDTLQLNPDLTPDELSELRKGWDLLIDIDSPFLDCSKIAAQLLIAALERHGVNSFGIKFSGSKGFHLIVPWKSFPEEYDGKKTKNMFPEWPRAIVEYLLSYIRKDYNSAVASLLTNTEAIKERMNISSEDLMERYCTSCNRPAQKGSIVFLECSRCKMQVEQRNPKLTKRNLRCLNAECPGERIVKSQRTYYYCDYCKSPNNSEMPLDSEKNPEYFEQSESASAQKIANLDLVLVAPRHLFRMPYSLHEKTALSSVVLMKDQIKDFLPRDANPLKITPIPYYPNVSKPECQQLLAAAIDWKRARESQEEKVIQKKYERVYDDVPITGVTEEMFPKPIKKLLKGLVEGRKRGLFILITFLRSLNFSPEEINIRIREWNKLNNPPLKEGYVRSQIDWHLRQKKKILPPNYDNASFYKDLNLLDAKPLVKNPIVEVMKQLRRSQS